jgi:hypothetical protein
MTDEYKTYKAFNDYGLAKELETTLVENNIEYVLDNTSIPFDPSFANNPLNQEYRIKIKPEDFVRANAVLENEAVLELQHVDQSHYLFDFSNEELMQLIAKRDEWSDFDFLLAKRILEERSINLEVSELAHIEEQRLEELGKPQNVNPGWIYAGFLFTLLGGVFGIIMGWFISTNTKTLPNGMTTYCYSEVDRKKGRIMLIVGIIMLISFVVLKVIKQI